jgi:phosphate:Na+ symporter
MLSFVGAGMLSMRNALGVALGANIGGTFNSWLVALLGFKADLGKFALPIIGIAGIGLIVFRSKKRIYQISKFLMGFGLLFLGLEYMKGSMDSMIKDFDFTPYLQYNRIVFVLIGFVITALIQTSAATIVIVLSALYANIIPIETAVAVVLGAELGTTIKVLIGSIGGIAAKKRVAFGNIIFNLFTSTLGFILLVPIIKLIRDVIGLEDPLLILVAFQTFINIMGVVIFYFFLDAFGIFLEKRFVDGVKNATHYLPNTSTETVNTAIEMVEKEVGLFIYRVINLNMEAFQIKEVDNAVNGFKTNYENKGFLPENLTYIEKYNLIKQSEGEIFAFYSKLSEEKIEKNKRIHLDQLISSIRGAMYSAKGIKDIMDDRKEFSNSINKLKFDFYELIRAQLTELYAELNKLPTVEYNTSSFEKLFNLLEKVKAQYEDRMYDAFKEAGKDKLKEVDISTLFNVNRELYSSCKSLISSMKDYLLDAEHVEKFENTTSFISK